MTEFRGFVKRINKKEGRGKRGPWFVNSVKLEKDDGSEYDNWLSAGFNETPNFKEGEYVHIEAEQDNGGFWKIVNSKVVKNAPAKASATTPGRVDAAAPGRSRESTIHYQSSRKDAIEVLRLLIDKDALPVSGAKTAAGVAKRYEEIMALVDKLTVRYFKDVETFRVLDSVIDEGEDDGDSNEAQTEAGEEADDE